MWQWMGRWGRTDTAPRRSSPRERGSCASIDKLNLLSHIRHGSDDSSSFKATYRSILVGATLGLEGISPADEQSLIAQLGEHFDVVLADLL